MKLWRFDDDRLGLVQGDELVDVTAALAIDTYSGTPEGVGPVKPGDEIRTGIEGIGERAVRVAADYAG
jgi:hypothetical protein